MKNLLLRIKKMIPIKVKRVLKSVIIALNPIRWIMFVILTVKHSKIANVSLIANNCIGADISKKLHLRYNTPTVNMQVLPGQFIKFITNLEYYLSLTPVEATSFSEDEGVLLEEIYGGGWQDNVDFPVGKIDDILLCFQHYKSFEEALNTWNRRKQRVNFDKIGYILIADVVKSKKAILDFYNLPLKNKALFLLDIHQVYPAYTLSLQTNELTEVHYVCCAGHHFMDKDENGKSYYEKNFDAIKYLNRISEG